MTVAVSEDIRTEAGVLVTLLLHRYLGDRQLLTAIASYVVERWLHGRHTDDSRSLEQWWEDYVGIVESALGGVDCAAEEALTRLWASHARQLLAEHNRRWQPDRTAA